MEEKKSGVLQAAEAELAAFADEWEMPTMVDDLMDAGDVVPNREALGRLLDSLKEAAEKPVVEDARGGMEAAFERWMEAEKLRMVKAQQPRELTEAEKTAAAEIAAFEDELAVPESAEGLMSAGDVLPDRQAFQELMKKATDK